MNIKDLFDKAEGGTLTYEQFEAAAKAADAKFTDLSEGKYVSKAKYDDDIKAKGDSLTQLNATIAQRDADLEKLKQQLAAAGTDSTKLAELQGQFDSLQGKYDSEIKDYQKKLQDQQYEFAVKEFAGTKKFTSNAAKRDFIGSMIKKQLKMEGDKILGAEDFVTSYSEGNADAFITEDPKPAKKDPDPKFIEPTSGKKDPEGEKNPFNFNFMGVRPKKEDK